MINTCDSLLTLIFHGRPLHRHEPDLPADQTNIMYSQQHFGRLRATYRKLKSRYSIHYYKSGEWRGCDKQKLSICPIHIGLYLGLSTYYSVL